MKKLYLLTLLGLSLSASIIGMQGSSSSTTHLSSVSEGQDLSLKELCLQKTIDHIFSGKIPKETVNNIEIIVPTDLIPALCKKIIENIFEGKILRTPLARILPQNLLNKLFITLVQHIISGKVSVENLKKLKEFFCFKDFRVILRTVINKKGDTLIHNAARLGKLDVMRILLEEFRIGVDVEKKDHATPLYLAVQEKQLEMVKLLIKHGAQVNKRCNLEKTPLFAAALVGAYDEAVELIKAGAIVNVKACEDITPLHMAVMKKEVRIVKLLLENGADITTETCQGLTAFALTFVSFLKSQWIGNKRDQSNDKICINFLEYLRLKVKSRCIRMADCFQQLVPMLNFKRGCKKKITLKAGWGHCITMDFDEKLIYAYESSNLLDLCPPEALKNVTITVVDEAQKTPKGKARER